MKKTILAALVVISLAGCQGKSDYGTASDAPLPPDPMANPAQSGTSSTPPTLGDPAKSAPESASANPITEGTKTGG